MLVLGALTNAIRSLPPSRRVVWARTATVTERLRRTLADAGVNRIPLDEIPLRASKADNRASVAAGVNDPNPPRAPSETRGLIVFKSPDALIAGDNTSVSMEIAPADAPMKMRRLRTTRFPLNLNKQYKVLASRYQPRNHFASRCGISHTANPPCERGKSVYNAPTAPKRA